MSLQLFTTIMKMVPDGYYFNRVEQAQQFYCEAIENEVDASPSELRTYTAEMFDVFPSDVA